MDAFRKALVAVAKICRIDTTGWDLQNYNFTASPASVSLFNGTLDYTQDIAGPGIVNVPLENVGAAAFSFTLVDDGCPNDPEKTDPGICGCGTPDDDSDSDGTEDCNDACPNDANKTAAGQCGCGNPDSDADSDGVLDCNDGCPNDSEKIDPGICDCGTPDDDSALTRSMALANALPGTRRVALPRSGSAPPDVESVSMNPPALSAIVRICASALATASTSMASEVVEMMRRPAVSICAWPVPGAGEGLSVVVGEAPDPSDSPP